MINDILNSSVSLAQEYMFRGLGLDPREAYRPIVLVFGRKCGALFGRKRGALFGRKLGALFGGKCGALFGRKCGALFGRKTFYRFDTRTSLHAQHQKQLEDSGMAESKLNLRV
ncbi:hypothetical protein RRG08_019540 [Elysia crispata]|uniref:Uncharacterized protein n=1 Tax=Elysia crispata TaxID=231223 RepID=A0AAE0YWZ6_9GAST|nr:hypothetical protein RRG08_019540 [Elysia crispata]